MCPVNLVKPYPIISNESAYYFAGSLPRQSRMSLQLWKAHQHFIAKMSLSKELGKIVQVARALFWTKTRAVISGDGLGVTGAKRPSPSGLKAHVIRDLYPDLMKVSG